MVTGVVGQPAKQSSGTTPPLRSGAYADLIMSQLHGCDYEQTFNQNMFAVANQAVVAITANFNTTYTGLVLGNPAGSMYNLAIRKFGFAQGAAASAATTLGLMTGAGAVTGSLTPRNRFGGGRASVATCNAGMTLNGTPVLENVFASVGTLATTGYGTGPMSFVDLDGSMIIPPGYFVAVYSTAANTAAWIFSFMYEEVGN